MTDKMREEFEKCWRECGNCEEDDIYNTNEYEVFKFAWKASRAALCVELPKQYQTDSIGAAYCVDAVIDSAGVQYK